MSAPSVDDLLRAVAERCQADLAALMEARLARTDLSDGPAVAWERLRVAGHAYVDFALSEPGLFRTAFAIPLDMTPPAAGDGRGAYEILASVLDGLVTSGAIPPQARAGAEFVAWSAVHGIATLITDGSLRDLPPEQRDGAIDRVINAVAF